MRTYIEISEPLRKELITGFGVDRATVYRALNYLSNSEQSDAIRSYALNNGGLLKAENTLPCSIHVDHDEVNKTMIFTVNNGETRAILSKRDSSGSIWKGDTLLERYDEPIATNGWGNLLYRACELAMNAS